MNTIEATVAFFTSWMGILLYWLPLAVCVIGYAIRTGKQYRKDVKARKEAEEKDVWYAPGLRVGDIAGRGLASVTPALNLFCAFFDLAPKLLSSLFDWFGRVLDQPLVPRRKKD